MTRMMPRGIRSRIIAAAVAFLVAGAAIVVYVRIAGAATAPVPSLTTVDALTLSRSGITLAAPEGAPSISQADAELLLRNTFRYPNVTITEMVLAQYHSRRIPGTGTLCWVASLAGIKRMMATPPGQPAQILEGQFIVALDATSGTVVETWQRAGPKPSPSP